MTTLTLNEAQAAAQAETERLARAEGAEIFNVTQQAWKGETDEDEKLEREGAVYVNMEYSRKDGSEGHQSIIYAADGKVLDVADWG